MICTKCGYKKTHLKTTPKERARGKGQYRGWTCWHCLHMKRMYGLTHEAYLAKIAAQNNLCLICQIPFKSTNTKMSFPHVDHCHTNKNVRGILCQSCNLGIGHFKENPSFLKAAIEYLAKC